MTNVLSVSSSCHRVFLLEGDRLTRSVVFASFKLSSLVWQQQKWTCFKVRIQMTTGHLATKQIQTFPWDLS